MSCSLESTKSPAAVLYWGLPGTTSLSFGDPLINLQPPQFATPAPGDPHAFIETATLYGDAMSTDVVFGHSTGVFETCIGPLDDEFPLFSTFELPVPNGTAVWSNVLNGESTSDNENLFFEDLLVASTSATTWFINSDSDFDEFFNNGSAAHSEVAFADFDADDIKDTVGIDGEILSVTAISDVGGQDHLFDGDGRLPAQDGVLDDVLTLQLDENTQPEVVVVDAHSQGTTITLLVNMEINASDDLVSDDEGSFESELIADLVVVGNFDEDAAKELILFTTTGEHACVKLDIGGPVACQ